MPFLRTSALLVIATLATAAYADPPNACDMLTAEDINAFAERKVEKKRPQRSGNPSECGFLDSRNGAVLVVSLKEVRYAVKDEFDVEKANLEKIYKGRAKLLETVGDGGFWMAANKSLWFRKGKVIGSVKFQTPKNQNEIDTGQIARLVESRIPN